MNQPKTLLAVNFSVHKLEILRVIGLCSQCETKRQTETGYLPKRKPQSRPSLAAHPRGGVAGFLVEWSDIMGLRSMAVEFWIVKLCERLNLDVHDWEGGMGIFFQLDDNQSLDIYEDEDDMVVSLTIGDIDHQKTFDISHTALRDAAEWIRWRQECSHE